MGTSTYAGYAPSLAVADPGFVAFSGVHDGVRVVHLGPDGLPSLERRVEIRGAGYTAFALREAQIALATLSGARETRSLTFRVLDADLREVSPRVIVDGAPTASRPRVLARPETAPIPTRATFGLLRAASRSPRLRRCTRRSREPAESEARVSSIALLFPNRAADRLSIDLVAE